MKSKTITVIFILIAVFLILFFCFSGKFINKNDSFFIRAKIITPKTSEVVESEADKISVPGEVEKYETFVPLLAGETLISTLTVDLNNDGYDDEVIVVRKNTSPYLWIIPGIYDFETGEYTRMEPIQTSFTRTRTFSYSAMDIIGDHKNALIYQGIDDDGNYLMKIFLYKTRLFGDSELVNIGDFVSDGTVFIQQTERSESYELGVSKGASYSVWIYKSEELTEEQQAATKKNVGLNQIQQEYVWNPLSEKYELKQEIKVTASRLVAKELSRIQDGTVESFANFLNGLWYKTSNADGKIRYFYFNYNTKEIIHLFSDTQEVYQWENSKLRHNGIYLTTVNADIVNLHRRFDISLTNVDEIRITVRDDINLIIKESTLWDGLYKKLSIQNSFIEDNTAKEIDDYEKILKKASNWVSTDGITSIKFTDYKYSLKIAEVLEDGIYSFSKIGADIVLMFRSDSETSLLNDAYSLKFGIKVITETIKRKTVEKTVTDYDTIIFTPVKVTPTDCFATEEKNYTFVREQ